MLLRVFVHIYSSVGLTCGVCVCVYVLCSVHERFIIVQSVSKIFVYIMEIFTRMCNVKCVWRAMVSVCVCVCGEVVGIF